MWERELYVKTSSPKVRLPNIYKEAAKLVTDDCFVILALSFVLKVWDWDLSLTFFLLNTVSINIHIFFN